MESFEAVGVSQVGADLKPGPLSRDSSPSAPVRLPERCLVANGTASVTRAQRKARP